MNMKQTVFKLLGKLSITAGVFFLILANPVAAAAQNPQEQPQEQAQEQTQEQAQKQAVIQAVEVIEVVEADVEDFAGEPAPYQLLRIAFESEDGRPLQFIVKHGGIPTVNFPEYEAGDQIYVRFNQDPSNLSEEETLDIRQVQVIDYVRHNTIVIMLIIFIAAVIIVNGLRGIRSIISLILSFVVIFLVVLPMILQNVDPVLVASLLAALIIPITFYLSHGWQKKTHIAVLATVIALIFSSLLATTFIQASNLSGLSSEEAGFLTVEQGTINVRGLLLAGIIIALLGTLDDITVTQAGLVFSLKRNNRKLKFKQLYQQSMEVGRDHITSMVNTLVLVYTGASLPLLLLFVNNPHPLGYVLSQELVVEEIVRTLVSSIGLIAAAPLTSLLAAITADWKNVGAKLQIK